MPSGTVAAGCWPWRTLCGKFETWSERTKNVTLPFDEDASPSRTNLNTVELEAVRALAHRIHSMAGYRKRIECVQGEKRQ